MNVFINHERFYIWTFYTSKNVHFYCLIKKYLLPVQGPQKYIVNIKKLFSLCKINKTHTLSTEEQPFTPFSSKLLFLFKPRFFLSSWYFHLPSKQGFPEKKKKRFCKKRKTINKGPFPSVGGKDTEGLGTHPSPMEPHLY